MTVRVTGRLGPYEDAIARRLDDWDRIGFGRRLWERDATLWFDPPQDEITTSPWPCTM